jgi:hypothetical protein
MRRKKSTEFNDSSWKTHLEGHLLERRGVVLHADAVEGLVAAVSRHEVRD